jgi:hypothetical protein
MIWPFQRTGAVHFFRSLVLPDAKSDGRLHQRVKRRLQIATTESTLDHERGPDWVQTQNWLLSILNDRSPHLDLLGGQERRSPLLTQEKLALTAKG